jgi:DNA-binding response OmpR family regulator
MMRVLICEDDGLLASELGIIAGEAGCEVTGIAATADEALRKAAETRPDVAIVDLHLGDGRSGADLAAALADQRIRIMVVSGDTSVDPVLARIDHVFLAKPVNLNMLRALLTDHASALREYRSAAA